MEGSLPWFSIICFNILFLVSTSKSILTCLNAFLNTLFDLKHMDGGLITRAGEQIQSRMKNERVDFCPCCTTTQLLKNIPSIHTHHTDQCTLRGCRCNQCSIGIYSQSTYITFMSSNRFLNTFIHHKYMDNQHPFILMRTDHNLIRRLLRLRNGSDPSQVFTCVNLINTFQILKVEYKYFVIQYHQKSVRVRNCGRILTDLYRASCF